MTVADVAVTRFSTSTIAPNFVGPLSPARSARPSSGMISCSTAR